MDVTNRILAIGVSLLWIFLVLLVILLAWGAPDQSIERLGDLAGYLEDHNTTGAKLIVTFGGLILILLAVLVILFEVAPPESNVVRVGKVGAGEARIGTDEVAHRLEDELRAMPQVSQVYATVQTRGNKAEVSLDLHVAAESDLAATTEEACRRARELVEDRMGVALARAPRAQLHYRELQLTPAQAAARAGPGEAPPRPSPFGQPADSEPKREGEIDWSAPPPPVTKEASDEGQEPSQERPQTEA